MTWYAPEDPTPREACDCCGYVTLAERDSWLICSVCFWMDDPAVRDGPGLAAAQASFARIGACNAESLAHVLPFAALGQIERRPVKLANPSWPRTDDPLDPK